MSIATQAQGSSVTGEQGSLERRVIGCRAWAHAASRWITVESEQSGEVTGDGFTGDRRGLTIPPEVGDRVRLVALDGTVMEGLWLGHEERVSGSVMVATVFTDEGESVGRQVAIHAADRDRCRTNAAAVVSSVTARALACQLAYTAAQVKTMAEEHRKQVDNLVKEAHQEATDRDWCSEFDDFMERMGLPRRVHSYEIRVEVPVSVYLTVEAADYEAAVESIDRAMVWDRLDIDDLDMSSADYFNQD